MTVVEEMRRFNRFYTRRIGLLNRHLPAGDASLPEARVLYELAQGGEQTAAALMRRLDMDKAHLSRIVSRLLARGLVQRRPSPDHGKHLLLSLTDAGRTTFDALERGTRAQLDTLLAPLGQDQRRRLVSAMRDISGLLDRGTESVKTLALRRLEPGDLGWIAHRQMRLYAQEYGWDWTYEGMVCGIMARFVAEFDPGRDDAWVAEHGGAIVGSVFLVKTEDPAVARLRLLYVEAAARGLGIGRRLVAACVDRARALGYRELTLWTNDVLVAARRLYQAAGFRLVGESPHRSFGHDLVGQTWTLTL